MKLLRKFCAPFRKGKLEAEMSEEMQLHLEQRTRENRAAGMSPDEAHYAALRKFGGVEQAKEIAREQRVWVWLEQLLQDTRHTVRSLRKHPGFTIVAVVSLAIGIGANTAVFSVIDAVMLRSLPVRDPHELRVLNWSGFNARDFSVGGNEAVTPEGATLRASFAYPTFLEFREHAPVGVEVFAFGRLTGGAVNAIGPDGAAMGPGSMVSGNFFSAFGARVALGRPIHPDDDRVGAEPVVVISHGWWEQHFGGEPRALGQTLTLNGQAYTIVGILPRGFTGPRVGRGPDFYVPIATRPKLMEGDGHLDRNTWNVELMARVTNDMVDDTQLEAAFDVLFRQSLSAPDSTAKMSAPAIVIEKGGRPPRITGGHSRQPALILQAIVAIVLLIACANLAGLMLSRAAARQHELAVRAAIGAGRGRLFRQAIVESLLLALGGAGLGLFVAAGVKVALVRFFPEFDAPLDSGVLLFTMAVALLTAVLCGLLPALHCARIDPALGLQHARGSLAPRLRIGRLLIVLQVALSLWLVIGAGLLLQTIVHLRRIDPGFVANNIVLAGLDPAQAGYSSERAIDLYRRLRGEVAALPGVADVALTSNALIDGGYSTWALQRPGDRQQVSARYVVVSDGFFAMLGIPLRRGREFTPGDRKGAPFITIVNESLASKLFPGEDALGRSFTIDHHALEIVGICGDARNSSFRRNPPPTFYLSHAQDWSYGPSLLLAVRSGLPTEALVPGIRKVLAAIDATVPLGEVTTLTGRIDHSIRQERMFATLCTALAVLAMLLCCVGLYGLLSYNVARRTHEFGIRLALGANPEKLARPILREGVALASLGAALSLPAVFGLSMLIGKILFGVTPMDVMTIASAIVAMLFVAALAAWLPARRAAKVDPMVALRVE